MRCVRRGVRSVETGSDWTLAKEVTRLQQRVAGLSRELEIQRAVGGMLHEGAVSAQRQQQAVERRLLQVRERV